VFYEVLDEAFIVAAHRHDMPTYAFTINDEPTLRRLIAMGVDGIETDDLGLLVRLVTELGRR
jgi:glycerophosphoryl diester phosphodiesterase